MIICLNFPNQVESGKPIAHKIERVREEEIEKDRRERCASEDLRSREREI